MPNTKLKDIEKEIRVYDKDAQLEVLKKAYDYAVKYHAGQKRKTGDDYVMHPINVCLILAKMRMDMPCLCAAVLHDVVEDTEATLDDIKNEFGEEIAFLVDGLTKLKNLKLNSFEEEKVVNYRKFILAMASDIRVVLIKLADRLHNMRTVYGLSPDRQKRYARETMEIYAPIANRLGISNIRCELEDRAFEILNNTEYKAIESMIVDRVAEREKKIAEVKKELEERIESRCLKGTVEGRPKHLYSVYKKMKDQNRQFEEIFDLLALRVITDNRELCYAILGLVHELWKPVPNRVKDFIAVPKPNMYQSLHTTVIGPGGRFLEVQIRTQEMHWTAEYGVAAHWFYKESRDARELPRESKEWLGRIVEWQAETGEPGEYIENFKLDLFPDDILVLTPQKDVVCLPAGSGPIDFAYGIHTEVGHTCIGAKTNGRIVPLTYKLKTGDVIEIITSKSSKGPSKDWLKIVSSTRAKHKIRQYFKKERYEEDSAEGKNALAKEMKKRELPQKLIAEKGIIEAIAQDEYKIKSVEELFVQIAQKKASAIQVCNYAQERLIKLGLIHQEEEFVKKERTVKKHDYSRGVTIDGKNNLLLRFARCCYPFPGDNIIGVILRGNGISVHVEDCPNVKHMIDQGYKSIDVSWDETELPSLPVSIEVKSFDREGLLKDLSSAIADTHANILYANLHTTSDNVAIGRFTIELGARQHLDVVMKNLRKVKNVFEVNRVFQDF